MRRSIKTNDRRHPSFQGYHILLFKRWTQITDINNPRLGLYSKFIWIDSMHALSVHVTHTYGQFVPTLGRGGNVEILLTWNREKTEHSQAYPQPIFIFYDCCQAQLFLKSRVHCKLGANNAQVHRYANRETAFVHAISSAGVMYTLTRNCSMGDFDNCGCDDSRNGQRGGHGWLWGGCSDNVGFAEAIAKQFVDALETGQDARAAMNLHNNEAGRKAVKGTMQKTCKCHGVSGSCTTQTCWLQLPEFREVGNYLKEKYHRALKVDLLRGGGNSAASRGAVAETFSSISRKELVHLEDSPDYCLENRTLGLPGTEGRECLKKGKNLSKWEKRSCKRLCAECGLAVEERKAETVSSCNCKFHWCCAVKCEQCRKTLTKFFCVKRRGARGRNESAVGRRKTLKPGKKH
ncbi:protein Wnt-8b isoform X1 [Corythoichthys intestinalis]|uniref:protein Wnt-8b isoform X1 n=1 Tax=Corythoichthys intestinalis TaxID=161448 RepID=UPI0025A6239A|nr:protein Wnt-8b isoform X1 [Corythoichthys intestinalis]